MNQRDAKRAVAKQVLALIKENQTKLFEQIFTATGQDAEVRESAGDSARVRTEYNNLLALLEDRTKPRYDGKIRW